MDIIDELRQKTEAGLKTLKETAQDIAFNVEKQATIGKKRYLDITKIQKKMQVTHAEIGEYIYDQYSAEKTISKDDPFISDRINSLTRMRFAIKDLEEEIEEIKKTHPPRRDL
jgi:hypothetical protein